MKIRNGFTLIELLVVIAIIAILAAVLMPVFNLAKERGRQVNCTSNLRQLSQAMIRYTDDYDGRLPNPSSQIYGVPDWCGSPFCGAKIVPERAQIWSYLKNKGILQCASDRNKRIGNIGLSYSMNSEFRRLGEPPMKLGTATAGRTNKILLLIHEGPSINDGFFAWPNNFDLPDKIHFEGTIVAYADSHVKWYSFNELVRQRNSGQWYPISDK